MSGQNDDGPTVGYVPLHPSMRPPGDRRRFPAYADDRCVPFSVVGDWAGLDMVVVSSEVDLVRWRRAPKGLVLVVDLPDAFLDEGRSLRTRARGMAKWIAGPLSRPVVDHHRTMGQLLERADAVVCSTPEQAGNLGQYSSNVHVALDLHREITPVAPVRREGVGRLDVVWEGLFPTLTAIEPVLPALRDLSRSLDVVLHLVTDRRAPRFMNRFLPVDVRSVVSGWGIAVEIHDWGVDVLSQVARGCDLAIVPVDRTDPYTLGKPENRMRIFWRLGLAVLGSESPSHRRACTVAGVSDDVLCVTTDDWSHALERYGRDADVRARVAEAGHDAAMGPYGDEPVLSAWDAVFESVGVQWPDL